MIIWVDAVCCAVEPACFCYLGAVNWQLSVEMFESLDSFGLIISTIIAIEPTYLKMQTLRFINLHEM